jgi:hypothetical protein
VPEGIISKKAWERSRAIPLSMPGSQGAVDSPWSSVPLWRGLDAAFLCEPAIPKAPPAPRIQLESPTPVVRVSGAPQVNDVVLRKPAPLPLPADRNLPASSALVERRPISASSVRMLLFAVALGFLIGLVAAWCFGLLG